MRGLAALVAAVALGAAAPLCARPRPRVPDPEPRVTVPTAGLVAVGFLVAGTLVAALGPQRAGGPVLLLAAAGAWVGLWRRRRRTLAAVAVSARVLETCQLLGAELVAGRPPGSALQRAAAEWAPLSAAAEAFVLGSDVPEALRRLSGVEGAEDLRLLAGAWQVAHRTGHGLAVAVESVAEDLRASQATRRVVESELASARATAHLVAALPVPVLVLGGGAGGDPWGFLLGTPVGLGCLALGLTLLVAGLWWIEDIAASVWRGSA